MNNHLEDIARLQKEIEGHQKEIEGHQKRIKDNNHFMVLQFIYLVLLIVYGFKKGFF